MKEKAKKVGKASTWIIFIIVVIILYVTQIQKVNDLKSASEFTNGTITGINKVAKGTRYVHYTFTVDRRKYEGSVSVSYCDKCSTGCCNTGTVVRVRYERNNPENNDLVEAE